jgi:hypothetical protein
MLQNLRYALRDEYNLIIETWLYSKSYTIFEAPKYIFVEKDGFFLLPCQDNITDSLLMKTGIVDTKFVPGPKKPSSESTSSKMKDPADTSIVSQDHVPVDKEPSSGSDKVDCEKEPSCNILDPPDIIVAIYVTRLLPIHEQNNYVFNSLNKMLEIMRINLNFHESEVFVGAILVHKLHEVICGQLQKNILPPISLHGSNISLLLLNCIIIAHKILEDKTWKNSTYAELFGFSLTDIDKSECDILNMLDFQVNISLEFYEECREKILSSK